MALDLTCLRTYPDIPSIPLLVNKSTNLLHSIYNPDGNNLLSKISSSITHSAFSSSDVQTLLKTLTNTTNPLRFSTILSTPLISSILIYLILILFLFVISSILFYIISYSNIKEFESSKQKYSKTICMILLFILYLLIFIQMIFLIKHINKSEMYLDNSIKEINQEFYPKSLHQHFEYLIKQFNSYSTKSSSMIIDGSKSILMKSFYRLLKEFYYIEDLTLFINNIDQHFNELNRLVVNDTTLTNLFNQLTLSYRDMINNLKNLNEKLCDNLDGNNIHIEEQIFNSLNIIHLQSNYFIQMINEQFLNKINSTLLNKNQEEDLHFYIALISTLIIIIIVIITVIPSGFGIFVLLNRLYFYFKNKKKRKIKYKSENRNEMKLRYLDVRQLQQSHIQNNHSKHIDRYNNSIPRRKHPSKKVMSDRRNANDERSYSLSDTNLIRSTSEPRRRYHLLCLMRIGFAFLIISIIVLILLTAVFYGLDLFVQGSCRLVHHDQSFLISFIPDNLIKSISGFDAKGTFVNLINNCDRKSNFSETFSKEFSEELNNKLIPILKDFNGKIYNEFLNSIKMINISSDLHLLSDLANLAGLIHIQNHIIVIENDFNQINKIFIRIFQFNSQLTNQFIIQTLNKFEFYFKDVIESTIDSCLLPIDAILKADRLICHETINGLWLRTILFMFLVVFGLCIFGIYIYKR